MIDEITSKEELYKRVKPALRAKKRELARLGYYYIKETDIWNYLIQSKWLKSHDLMLSDVVDDILNSSNRKLDHYVKEQMAQKTTNNIEVL